ncbi:uncharacterized protein LOC123004884 isoform X4 [Tribolium madens]|uniref:uncharacterized protein LOC123004884 isoform X4 n=1 Tax=Tribolium madens TaxID=41895 RepID=UPI001CF7345B|nr:uncharacterized protein LOC123004884 isoform X4 [Tribolium madens]
MSITRVSKMPFELNNNLEVYESSYKRNRNESIVSVSSASSFHSDSSEDAEGLSRKSSIVQELTQKDNVLENADFRRFRSMSDGAAYRLPNQEPFEVFPSLPDSVLEKMGLLGNGPRERLSDEELEQKFVSLSLAFTIDAATIKDRCERQRRYRDQTETNLNTEIEKLIEKANKMQSLCVDAETTELLSSLLGQIDIVMKASSHATISSERYGAVQHEHRISESVNVMINHVNLLKQQRDSARRQLQYTKLGVDLVKIKEGMVENEPMTNESCNSDNESIHEDDSSPEDSAPSVETDISPLPLRHRLVRRFRRLRKGIEERYDRWTEDGTIHEICCFCALMCFSISLIIMANLLIEVEFSKRGLTPSNFFWFWTTNNGNTQISKRIYQGGISTT